VLDLDKDGKKDDPIDVGAYVTGSEVIGRLPVKTAAVQPPGRR
jgi:hypothetical protein